MDAPDFEILFWLGKEEEMLRCRELADGHADEAWREALRFEAMKILLKSQQ